MSQPEPKPVYLKDYSPSSYQVKHIDLDFDIRSVSEVLITATSHFQRGGSAGPLSLDGNPDLVKLQSISLNGQALGAEDYQLTPDHKLLLANPPEEFELTILASTDPTKNSSCIGLYTSEGILCTQCESEGYRNFTYALDRPDVFSTYRVSIQADQEDFPHLLSNGKKISTDNLADGRHRIVWEDLRPKPTYLFALAAGKFDVVKDSFTYPSGKSVALEYYVNVGDAHRVEHAMECLKAAMQHEWEKWGHEYHSDSGVFMTLAVDAFIFGAMENTGLNIFNSSAVLADAKTATDGAFKNIDRIIDHEFCHDESGNWVVPRDWFQISFKEGLTVFRDQTYTADRYGRTLSQISNVRRLRGMVFPYDSGAMTHPMVLQSYLNTDNNYDVLTYPKGAAVNRMIQTLVGEEAYEKAYREFFSNKEVKTATIEEYFRAIARSSGKNLDQFIGTWLNQAGVPELEIQTEYKEAEKQFVLKIKQILSVSQDDPQGKKTAFHIPLIIGLVGPQGQDYPLENGGLLEITELENHFVFSDIPQRPRLSLNRDGITYARFSYTEDSTPSSNDLTFLSQKDPNPFKRWDALQEQSTQILLDLIDQKKEKVSQEELQPIIDAFASVLRDQNLDDGLKADLLVLPSGGNLTDLQAPGTVDPVRIYNLRKSIVQTIGKSLEDLLLKTYESKTSDAPYVFNPEEMNRRSLMNTCLSYLVQGNEGQYLELALKQFDAQQNYNDVISALEEISESKNEEIRQTCFNKMYEEWKDNKLVMNTWISFRIFSDSNPLELAKELESHPVFDINNPNKVRALVGGFIGNTPHFHKEDGSGYAYLADWIIRLDEINPIIASGMARVFTKRSIYIERIQKQLQEQIERIRQERGDKLSSNVKEVLDRSSMK